MSVEPPQNAEAEMAVLGSMLLDGQMAKDIRPMLSESDFYMPAYRILYQAILDLMETTQPDLVTLRNHLYRIRKLDRVGGTDAIAALLEVVPTSANGMHYAEIVKDYSIRRTLIESGRQLISESMNGDLPGAELALKYEQNLKKLEGSNEKFFHQIGDDLAAAVTELKRLDDRKAEDRPLCELTTGIAQLDKFIALEPGTVTLIAARPSMGKTTLALNLMRANSINGKIGAFFSLEMRESRLARNMVISHTGIDAHRARTGKMTDGEKLAINREYEKLIEFPGIWTNPTRMTPEKLRLWSRHAVMRHGAKYIIVDYVQRMKGEGRTTVERLDDVSDALKEVAADVNIAVIALAQLNRECEKRTVPIPQLQDLKGTGNLEQDADMVLLLYRPFHYKEVEEERYLMRIHIAKNRDDKTGVVKAFCDLNSFRIRNWQEESE